MPIDEGDAESVEADEEKLLSLLPPHGAAIENGNLRDQLGWDEDTSFGDSVSQSRSSLHNRARRS